MIFRQSRLCGYSWGRECPSFNLNHSSNTVYSMIPVHKYAFARTQNIPTTTMENKNEPLFFPGGVHITYYTIQLNCTHEQHAHSVWAYTPPVEFTSHYFDTIYTCSVLLSVRQYGAWFHMRTRVCEFEVHLRWNVLLLPYLNTCWYQVYSTRYILRGGSAVAPDADHPTRTLTRTRTLWGDLCLDAVACEGPRLIRPKGDAVDGGGVFEKSRTRVCI